MGGISTYGAPWWWIRLVVRDPGRVVVMKGLKPLCAKGCRAFWLGLYRMDPADATRRRAFLDRVEAFAAGFSPQANLCRLWPPRCWKTK